MLWISVWLLAFSSSLTLAFGAHLSAWSTVGDSLISLLKIPLGQADLPAMALVSPFIAPLLYGSYLLLIGFVLLNMLTSIVFQAYAEANAKDPKLNLIIVLRSAVRRQWARARSVYYLDFLRKKQTVVTRRASLGVRRASMRDEADSMKQEKQQQRNAREVEAYLEHSRHQLINGHAHTFTQINQGLKALVFTHQSKSEVVRDPLLRAVTEMRQLQYANHSLKRAANQAGWSWSAERRELVRGPEAETTAVHTGSRRAGERGGRTLDHTLKLAAGSREATPSGTARTAPELYVIDAEPLPVERHKCSSNGGYAPAMKLAEERRGSRISQKPLTR